MNRGLIAVAATLMTLHVINAETVIDFEELSVFNGQPPSGDGQYFDGYGAGASDSGFTSQGVFFSTNQFGPGWSYSNANDVDSPGFRNQFAAFPGGGSVGDGSALIGSNYALVNTGSLVAADGTPQNGASLTFGSAQQLTSLDVANTTYSLLFMRDGKDTDFPGNVQIDPDAAFTDGDFLLLRITGFDGMDGQGNVTGTLDYDLANYGGPGTGDDVLLTRWDTIDLSGFGLTTSLHFSTTSSQMSEFDGEFYSDVPAYAAIDNLRLVTAIPEPASVVILTIMSVAIVTRRRRKI